MGTQPDSHVCGSDQLSLAQQSYPNPLPSGLVHLESSFSPSRSHVYMQHVYSPRATSSPQSAAALPAMMDAAHARANLMATVLLRFRSRRV